MVRLVIVITGMGCGTSSSPPTTPAPVAREVPVTHFQSDSRITIYPKVNSIPENALEFRVTAAEGQPAMGPVFAFFSVQEDQAVELPEALPKWRWNEDFTRAQFAPSGLSVGAPYILAAEGLSGADAPYLPHGKHFRVMPRDDDPPNGASLKVIGAPIPGTTNTLVVTYPEPMHEDSVHSMATLMNGTPLDAPWVMDDDQRTVRFTPREPWVAGDVRVGFGATIRDLAGNHLVGLRAPLLPPVVPVQ